MICDLTHISSAVLGLVSSAVFYAVQVDMPNVAV